MCVCRTDQTGRDHEQSRVKGGEQNQATDNMQKNGFGSEKRKKHALKKAPFSVCILRALEGISVVLTSRSLFSFSNIRLEPKRCQGYQEIMKITILSNKKYSVHFVPVAMFPMKIIPPVSTTRIIIFIKQVPKEPNALSVICPIRHIWESMTDGITVSEYPGPIIP